MNFTNVNFLAILVAAILNMVLGFAWYGPLFSKPWMGLQGWTKERMEQDSTNPIIYLIPFAGGLVTAYIVALLISTTQMGTLTGGIGIGLLAGLGFIVPAFASNYIFSSRPFKLYLIDAGYYLVSLLITGALLGLWR